MTLDAACCINLLDTIFEGVYLLDRERKITLLRFHSPGI
jgi:hypothetical protein